MTQRQHQQIFGLRDILTILFKHKLKILLAFGVIAIITAFVATSSVPLFVARSVVMIKPGRENIPMGDVISDQRVPMVSQEALVNTEMQIITSNDVIGSAVTAIGPFELYPQLKHSKATGAALNEAAIFLFKQNLIVRDVKGSNVIEILFRHPNPHMAEKGANVLTECLKDKHVQVYGTPKSALIEDQLKYFREKIAEAEAKMAAYKKDNKIVSMKDQYWWTYGKRTELESTLRMEESRFRELQDKVAFLKMQKRKVVTDLYTTSTRSRLTDLQQKETELLSTYKETSRPVVSVRKQIQVMKDTLAKYEEENKESSEWVLMEAELGPQKIKIANLRQQVLELDKSLSSLSEADRQYLTMERELDSLQKNYEVFVRKFEEMKIAEDMDRRKITNLNVIEQASLPVRAEMVNQKKIIGMGLLLAIVVGIGWAYMAEFLPQCITTPQGAERYLYLPVLVAISKKG